MASTIKKRLLEIALAGAEHAETAKEKLEFLKLAVIIRGGKNSKDLAGVNPDLAKLLGG